MAKDEEDMDLEELADILDDEKEQNNSSDESESSSGSRSHQAVNNLTIPNVPKWDNADVLKYDVKYDKETGEFENIVDYENLDSVNDTINSVRVALFRVTRGLDDTERKLRIAKTVYDRKFRREYLSSTQRTEAQKKVEAALMTEQLEDKIIYLEQMKAELQRRATLFRDELSAMTVLSNNIRQQIRQV